MWPARAQETGARWDGWYAGAVVGVAWTDVDLAVGSAISSDSYSSIVGGATGGFNVVNGNILTGIEADITFADLTSGMSLARHKVSLVGRGGILITSTTLLFAVAGVAGGQYEAEVTTTTTTMTIGFDEEETPIVITSTTTGRTEADKRLWDYTLGAGIETEMNGFAVPVRIGIEYRYTDFEGWNFLASGQAISIDPTVQEVSARLVFPF